MTINSIYEFNKDNHTAGAIEAGGRSNFIANNRRQFSE